MKKVLLISYSQSGQLNRVSDSFCAPLKASPQIQLDYLALEPDLPYPFPWPFLGFFNTFPETIYNDTPQLKPLQLSSGEDITNQTHYDLIILSYQVWFLSPSLPISAFLKTPEAKYLLKGNPVITLIGCRNMWLMAQEEMKKRLHNLQASLIDNVVLTDASHSAFTFISTPLWMLTGKRGPFLKGLIPAAGIPDADILAASRFGEAIQQQLSTRDRENNSPMLNNLGAVNINENLIASEKIGKRSFMIWGKLLRFLGKPKSKLRQAVLIFYIVFLVTMILTVVPITALIKKCLSPLTRKYIQEQKRYYAAPSGCESTPKA